MPAHGPGTQQVEAEGSEVQGDGRDLTPLLTSVGPVHTRGAQTPAGEKLMMQTKNKGKSEVVEAARWVPLPRAPVCS